MLPKIYVISLVRAADRRASITARLNAAGVSYEIIDAVDGAELDLDDYKDRLRNDLFMRRYDQELTRGEIGCFLSHYNLWGHMLDKQILQAIILEDDATWDDDFFDTIRDILNCEWAWNVVHLSHNMPCRVLKTLCEVGNQRKLVRFKHARRLTTAYMIDLEGAQKLHKHCHEIREQIDFQWLEYWITDHALYHVDPAPARQSEEVSIIGVRAKDKTLHTFSEKLNRFYRAHHKRYARRFYHWTHPPRKRK